MRKQHFNGRGIQGLDTGQCFTLDGNTRPLWGKMGTRRGAAWGDSSGCWLQLLLASSLEGAAFPNAPLRSLCHSHQGSEGHGRCCCVRPPSIPGQPDVLPRTPREDEMDIQQLGSAPTAPGGTDPARGWDSGVPED